MIAVADGVYCTRKQVIENIETLMDWLRRESFGVKPSGGGLFAGLEDASAMSVPGVFLKPGEEWGWSELLRRELASAQVYVSGHPIDECLVQRLNGATHRLSHAPDCEDGETIFVACAVDAVERKKSRRGNDFLVVQLSEPGCAVECALFGRAMTRHAESMVPGARFLAELVVEQGDFETTSLKIESVRPLYADADYLQSVSPVAKRPKPAPPPWCVRGFVPA